VTRDPAAGVSFRRMENRTLILVALVGTLTGACGRAPTDPLKSAPRAVVDATVQYLSLEGGCWTLELSGGVHYLPRALPDQFRQDGLQVRAALLRLDDYSSSCMVGPVVEILSIKPR
jgi:hypothetical protein